MTEEAPMQSQHPTRLEAVSRRLHHLIDLRAALAPFRITLHTLGERVQEPEGRRRLLTLWRLCQQRLDLLLDTAPQNQGWAVRLRLLRQEVEDHLLDEVYSPAALTDLADGLDQACEALLLEVGRDLREAVAEWRGKTTER
jgi:hypothetical protein